VKVDFADPKKRYTRAFERYALELSQHMDKSLSKRGVDRGISMVSVDAVFDRYGLSRLW
jgi:hypothetical protein